MSRSKVVRTRSQNRGGAHPKARAAVIAIAVLAGACRGYGLSELDVTHYDEGVYALWANGVDFPAKELFSPPLYPWVLKLAAFLRPMDDTSLFAVNVALGATSSAIAGYVALLHFGAPSGIAAAVLVASCGWHIVYSRSVLTDVLFVNWALLLLFAAAQATQAFLDGNKPGVYRWLLVAAACQVGAFYTKYSGLVLVVGVVGGAFLAAILATGRPMQAARWALSVSAVMALAMLAYLPWLVHVGARLGLEVLLTHHHGYVMGVRAWPQNAAEFFRYSRFLLPWATALGLAVLASWALYVRAIGVALLLCLSSAAILFAGDIVHVPAGLAAASWFCTGKGRRAICAPFLFVSLFCFVGATPLYRPYPRLGLPAMVLAVTSLAGLAAEVQLPTQRKNRLVKSLPRGFVLSFSALMAACLVAAFIRGGPSLPTPSEALRLSQAAERVVRRLPPDTPVCVFVRPSALFYVLQHVNVSLVGDATGINEALQSGRALVVDSALVRDNPDVARSLDQWTVKPVTSLPYRPAVYVWLNDWHHLARIDRSAWPYCLLLYLSRGDLQQSRRGEPEWGSGAEEPGSLSAVVRLANDRARLLLFENRQPRIRAVRTWQP